MDSNTIRERFFDFFGERDHARVPSASLVPNDPTLLLTNAGMNQFKPYFLGEQSPPFKRAESVQKCFRATDIDEVGKTARHLTFFEMLGNFSFGDYYKEKACPWAWELVTEGWGIEEDRLWATVYETDDEARDIWIDGVGVRPERVIKRGRKDNFWDMGVAGPCGPCSEIFVDLGPEFGEEARRRTRRQRGPLPRDLEPRLHAGHVQPVHRTGRAASQDRTSTPARASSALRWSCKRCHRFTRPTRSADWLGEQRSSRSTNTVRTPAPTRACECLPTTVARSRSSSPMEFFPRTKSGATSCAASCAGRFATRACWDARSRYFPS